MMMHSNHRNDTPSANPNRENDRKRRRRWLRIYELASTPTMFLVVIAGLVFEPLSSTPEAVPPPSVVHPPRPVPEPYAPDELLYASLTGSSFAAARGAR
jgi:hypothetical protein